MSIATRRRTPDRQIAKESMALASLRYHLTTETSHWGCADLCGLNASLACVQSLEENEYMARLAADAGVSHFWIGNYKRPSGVEAGGSWDVCQSGEAASFVNFDPEPANWHDAENCAFADSDGLWVDARCYLEFPCACEHGAGPSPEYVAFAEVERKRDKTLREAAVVLYYISLAVCSVVSGLSLIWALVCIIREVRRKQEQSAGAPGLEMVQSDARLGPHDQRVHASILSGDILLLRCSWLRSRPRGYVLPRRQDLPSEALLPPAEAAALFARQDRSACALTYGCAPRPATPRPALPLPCPRASHILHDRAHATPPRPARREPAARRGLPPLAHWAWLRRALLGSSELSAGRNLSPPPCHSSASAHLQTPRAGDLTRSAAGTRRRTLPACAPTRRPRSSLRRSR